MKERKWYSTYQHPEGLYFIIDEDSAVGFYLYLYQVKKFFQDDIANSKGCPSHQDDFLQNTLEFAKEQAFEDFGVPMDSWIEVQR